jgi:hypothetical protein
MDKCPRKKIIDLASKLLNNPENVEVLLQQLSATGRLLRNCKTLPCSCGQSNDKMYHYGITITRNPKEQTLDQFIIYAEKFKKMKYFREAESYVFGYEAFSDGKLINEHLHIQVSSLKYLSVKDFKKSFPHRIDVQRLKGLDIIKTRNYVQKDNDDIQTIEHYGKLLESHYGKKNA